MKYLGWIIAIITMIFAAYLYQSKYVPLKASISKLEQEIAMWEDVLKGEKGLTGDRNSFPAERFFDDDKLTAYAEVEIIRRFDPHYKGIEIFISAPNALTRIKDILRFLDEQKIEYQSMYCIAIIDSIEKFEYKYTK
ncbi:MAG TPA: hypothetical protein VF399_01585 [bacterium]